MSLLFIKRAIVGVLLCIPAVSVANNVDVSGFIGVGGIDDSKDGYRNIVESGVRLSGTLPANFSLHTQVLWRDYNNSIDSEPELDYGTLDWQLANRFGEQRISLGRFKANGGIYSNTRDMPFTRPSILLSGAIYSDDQRSVYEHIDGVRFSAVTVTDLGELAAEFGYGSQSVDEEFGRSVGGFKPPTINIDADHSWLFDLKYQTHAWLVNFSYRKLDVTVKSNFGFFEPRNTNRIGYDMDNYILGLQYSRGPWEFTAEGLVQRVKYKEIGLEAHSIYSIYFQPRYFINAEVALMGRIERTLVDGGDLDLAEDRRGISSYSTGLTWRPSERWQLSAEIHHDSLDDTRVLAQAAWRF